MSVPDAVPRPVVALDVATNTGVAVGTPGGTPRAWSQPLGEKGHDDSRHGGALRLVRDLIKLYEPQAVAIEAPIGGKETSHLLVGLVACIRGMTWLSGTPMHVATVSTVRKHFLGRALTAKDFPGMSKGARTNAIKGQVLLRCRQLQWDVADHDAADAAALWDYACSAFHRRQAAPLGDLFAPARVER